MGEDNKQFDGLNALRRGYHGGHSFMGFDVQVDEGRNKMMYWREKLARTLDSLTVSLLVIALVVVDMSLLVIYLVAGSSDDDGSTATNWRFWLSV